MIPFNPDDLEMDVDAFRSTDPALQAHFNRLVDRVNAIAKRLGADIDRGGGGGALGEVQIIYGNLMGARASLRVLAEGEPVILDGSSS
ncbi:MAG: hypothetical protein ABMA13_18370 [Chthoniobacteraceae bacterium]